MPSFTEMISQLKPISLGIVLVDKPENSDIIDVFPSEQLPFTEGKLNNRPDTKINATWIPFGQSNRGTSPDVVAGETVQLYRFADTEDYFWTTIFKEPSLRRLERVLYAWSNVPDKGVVQDKENSYFVEVSTKDKWIHVHTATNDGEKCGYDVLIDTKNGRFTLADTLENIINLDSEPGNLNVKLNGSIFGAITKDISLTCRDVVLNAKSAKISAETIGLKAAGKVDISGSTVKVTNLSASGGVSISGGMSLAGTLSSDSGATFGGTVNASGFNP